MEFSLPERFHGDGKHRRYVATCTEPQLDPQGMLDRPGLVSGAKIVARYCFVRGLAMKEAVSTVSIFFSASGN